MTLAPLYLRAAVSSVGPRADVLPDTVLARDVTVDRAAVADYARVCGFRLSDALPPTYPHVLGFALQVELMAGRSFPLALPGLVHVANTITVHRRIDAGEPLRIAVHAERFVGHPKGATVDLVTTADATGERVWEGRSTYLARGARPPRTGDASRRRTPDAPGPETGVRTSGTPGPGGPASGLPGPDGPNSGAPGPSGSTLGAPGPHVTGPHAPGPDLAEPHATAAGPPGPHAPIGPPSAVWRVTGDTGRRYAAVSGDVNPIHLHPLTARAFGFPRAIAHGMWTAARALAALEGRLPAAWTYDVAFARPLLLPSTVELRTRDRAGAWELDVRGRKGPHLTATLTARS